MTAEGHAEGDVGQEQACAGAVGGARQVRLNVCVLSSKRERERDNLVGTVSRPRSLLCDGRRACRGGCWAEEQARAGAVGGARQVRVCVLCLLIRGFWGVRSWLACWGECVLVWMR